MSSLRDEIARNIGEVYRMGAMQERGEPHYYSPYSEADAILAKVREAMLSNEVQAPIRHELHHYPRTSTRDTVKMVIDMALDAITTD